MFSQAMLKQCPVYITSLCNNLVKERLRYPNIRSEWLEPGVNKSVFDAEAASSSIDMRVSY